MNVRKQEADRRGELCLTSRLFLLFLTYTLWIWSCEFLDLLCYLVQLPQVSLLSRVLAAITALFAVRRLMGQVSFCRVPADGCFMAGSVVLAGFFALKAVIPDMSYDTQNYHLLCQIPGFVDNLHYHVLPGRFQMYGFRLGDRLFYPFRLLLGLRMGTLLNAAAAILVYRQLTVCISWFKESLCPDGGRFLRPSVPAFFLVCRYELLSQSGTYMVEILALPFLLEMLCLLLRPAESGDAGRAGREALVFCLLGGIFFSMKMTNIVYLLPLVLLYLFRIRRLVTPGLFLRCLLAGVLPVSVYLIYNGLSTGNPVYPYYNTIFGSPYFQDFNFKDLRWGPGGFGELLLWPYSMIRRPDYRLSELVCSYNLDLAAGYLAMLCVAALGVRAAVRGRAGSFRGELLLLAVYAAALYGWAATTGHSRYFMGGLLLNGLFIVLFCLRAAQSRRILPVLLGAALFFTLPARAWYGFAAVYQGHEWSFRFPDPVQYRQNARWVFRDRQIFPEEIREDADLILLTGGDFGGFARMIGENVPVFNRNAILSELSSFSDGYLSQAEGRMRDGARVYDMFQQGEEALTLYLDGLNGMGYYAEELRYPDQSLTGVMAYTLARLTLAEGRKNRWYYCREQEGGDSLTVTKTEDMCRMTAIAGNPNRWYDPAGFEVSVIASDGRTDKQAAAFAVSGTGYERVEVSLDLTGLEGEVELTFRSSSINKNGMIINPELSREADRPGSAEAPDGAGKKSG